MNVRSFRLVGLFALFSLSGLLIAASQSSAPPVASQSVATGELIPFSKSVTDAKLRSLPANARLALPSGGQLKMGDLRRLSALSSRMHTTPRRSSQALQVLRQRPAAQGRLLQGQTDIEAALALPDSDTLVLSSGRRLTAGQLKFLKPLLEKRLGRSLGGRASTTKPISVGPGSDWKAILQMPDNTRLQAPNGTVIRVGDLKQKLATSEPAFGSGR